MNRFRTIRQLISNMGWHYVSYRAGYEIMRQTGILKRKFPINPKQKTYLTLNEWKKTSKPFFFQSREELSFIKNPNENLRKTFECIKNGHIQFFNHLYFDLGNDYDWITNPENNYKYDINKHWTEVNDFNADAGDIKFVWEKSRFTFLYTIIRYDYHFDKDNSELVFGEIQDWISKNPINMGPNYKCSQEISLRILNWIFALYFYKNSIHLTEYLFQEITHNIHWQLHHVYNNINFSRIAVRNNHAITETLTLYIASMLFPQFPKSDKWKNKGKKWFEKEIDYQIYDDGTFLQFSMNYHRVVIQLLTWAISIVQLNDEEFSDVVYEKSYKSLYFLYQCQEDSNGLLPNYGSNDGALFFKLSDNDYQDFRPQLEALHMKLTNSHLYNTTFEDHLWYGNNSINKYKSIEKHFGVSKFEVGGYYLVRENDTLTFIRCGNHKDRPAHADNLHIDIWHKSENILSDCGTYKYNTDFENNKYFWGTESHNTLMIENYDQMLKGPRFTWFDWTQAKEVKISETNDYYYFTGSISCFRHVNENIVHTRNVTKFKNKPKWTVDDMLDNKPTGLRLRQLWHTQNPKLQIDSKGTDKIISEKLCSKYYGYLEKCIQMEFYSSNNFVQTFIQIEE